MLYLNVTCKYGDFFYLDLKFLLRQCVINIASFSQNFLAGKPRTEHLSGLFLCPHCFTFASLPPQPK